MNTTLIIISVLVVACLGVGYWFATKTWNITLHPFTVEKKTNRKIGRGWVYGVPGGNIAANTGGFAATNVTAGVEGEKNVGRILEDCARRTGAVVVHGARFNPNNFTSQADIDHAIVVSNSEVWLVDAKMWRSGSYSWGSNETSILCDQAPFPGGTIHIADAVRKWRTALGDGVTVKGFLVLALEGKKRYRVKGHPTRSGVTLVSLHDFNQQWLTSPTISGVSDWQTANKVVEAKL